MVQRVYVSASVWASDLKEAAILLEEFEASGTYYVRQDHLLAAIVVQPAQTLLQDRSIQSHLAIVDTGCQPF